MGVMAISLRPSQLNRITFITCRQYCEKSIYQRNEEGEKPRQVYGQLYPDWRKPWLKRKGEWRSKLTIFVEKSPNPDIMASMHAIPNLTFQQIKDWWKRMKIIQEKENQKYLAERVAALGSNLAAVHFFLYREAAVRLRDSDKWMRGDITGLKLPSHYVDGIYVEAVDCLNFHHNGIRYEGVQNLTGLNYLKWLSLKNNRHVDVWCLDRIAGQNGKSLEYLDVSGCNFCEGCVEAISRMTALKYLIITDPGDNVEIQAGLSVLEEENPNLVIRMESN